MFILKESKFHVCFQKRIKQNTHKTDSLYKAFPPVEVRLIIKHIEIHDTLKHKSYLDMAEIDLMYTIARPVA